MRRQAQRFETENTIHNLIEGVLCLREALFREFIETQWSGGVTLIDSSSRS